MSHGRARPLHPSLKQLTKLLPFLFGFAILGFALLMATQALAAAAVHAGLVPEWFPNALAFGFFGVVVLGIVAAKSHVRRKRQRALMASLNGRDCIVARGVRVALTYRTLTRAGAKLFWPDVFCVDDRLILRFPAHNLRAPIAFDLDEGLSPIPGARSYGGYRASLRKGALVLAHAQGQATYRFKLGPDSPVVQRLRRSGRLSAI